MVLILLGILTLIAAAILQKNLEYGRFAKVVRGIAFLLILAAVLANVGFTALGSIFNYPDVLDEPAGQVLADFRAHEGAVSAWFTVLAVSAGLMAPIAIGASSAAEMASTANQVLTAPCESRNEASTLPAGSSSTSG